MARWQPAVVCVATALALLVSALSLPQPAAAGLFSKIFREAADNAGKGGKLPDGLANLDVPKDVARLVNGLPDSARQRALISVATPEGHVRLTNLKGDTVTASTPQEVDSALSWLLPDASDAGRRNVDFYFGSSALGAERTALNTLPRAARIHITHEGRSHPIVGSPPFRTRTLRVRLRPNLVVRATSPRVFREAAWQVSQPLKPSQVRVLSLDPETTTPLAVARTQTTDPATQIEFANPYDLAKSMRSLNRQTVVLTGSVEGKVLFFTPPDGKRQSVLLADLRNSAARDHVNLIILNTDSTRQPGVRNLLFQKTKIEGMDAALKTKTVGEFWSALVANRAPLELDLSASGKTYVSISAQPKSGLPRPDAEDGESLLSTTGRIFREAASNVAGNIVTNSVQIEARKEHHQQELDLRIIPFLPALPQIFYIMAIIVGFAGLATIKSWWRKLWPLRERAAFASTLGWIGNRIFRAIPFLLIFMPLVAYVATPYQLMRGPVRLIWRIVSAPFRWVFGGRRPA